MSSVVGWCDAYGSSVPVVTFTADRRQALVERIRKRKYNFNHFDHEMLGCAPVYADNCICVLTKTQFDSVMNEVYKDIPRGARLLPQDVIHKPPKNGILYEAEKFEPKGGGNNG
jgi:hypothetical protein